MAQPGDMQFCMGCDNEDAMRQEDKDAGMKRGEPTSRNTRAREAATRQDLVSLLYIAMERSFLSCGGYIVLGEVDSSNLVEMGIGDLDTTIGLGGPLLALLPNSARKLGRGFH